MCKRVSAQLCSYGQIAVMETFISVCVEEQGTKTWKSRGEVLGLCYAVGEKRNGCGWSWRWPGYLAWELAIDGGLGNWRRKVSCLLPALHVYQWAEHEEREATPAAGPCDCQQNCLTTKSKVEASTALNYLASFVLAVAYSSLNCGKVMIRQHHFSEVLNSVHPVLLPSLHINSLQ